MREFIEQCKRVLQLSHKPTISEYKSTIKISAIGICVIGLIGFLIYAIKAGVV